MTRTDILHPDPSLLDNPQTYKSLDPSGMLAHIQRLPAQCQAAWQQARQFSLPSDYSGIDRVIVLGMGGSAIGGELALGLLAGKAFALVQRDYGLPCPADNRTLVIASSYSGETEETLTAFRCALDSPARCLAITTGGRLKALAEEYDKPVFVIDYRSPPRAALASSLMPILAILHRLGLVPEMAADVGQAQSVMDAMARSIAPEVPLSENAAKQLAARLHGRAGIIYGAEFLTGVARRWKTQINENSKSWAFFETLPESNHNAVVGYSYPLNPGDRFMAVMLTSSLLNPRVQKRLAITDNILEHAGVPRQSINATGAAPFSQMMSLVLFGDYVSYYLALLNQVDPTPVAVIDFLKRSLE